MVLQETLLEELKPMLQRNMRLSFYITEKKFNFCEQMNFDSKNQPT